MTLWNVSTVMVPSLFLPRGRPPKLTKGGKQLAEGAAEVVCMMVQYQDLLWTVSDGSGSIHPLVLVYLSVHHLSICLSIHHRLHHSALPWCRYLFMPG